MISKDVFPKVTDSLPIILTFNDPETEGFGKHCEQRRKPTIFPFPTMFSTLPKTIFNFFVTFILSSTNAFNLDQSKSLFRGKQLTIKS